MYVKSGAALSSLQSFLSLHGSAVVLLIYQAHAMHMMPQSHTLSFLFDQYCSSPIVVHPDVVFIAMYSFDMHVPGCIQLTVAIHCHSILFDAVSRVSSPSCCLANTKHTDLVCLSKRISSP